VGVDDLPLLAAHPRPVPAAHRDRQAAQELMDSERQAAQLIRLGVPAQELRALVPAAAGQVAQGEGGGHRPLLRHIIAEGGADNYHIPIVHPEVVLQRGDQRLVRELLVPGEDYSALVDDQGRGPHGPGPHGLVPLLAPQPHAVGGPLEQHGAVELAQGEVGQVDLPHLHPRGVELALPPLGDGDPQAGAFHRTLAHHLVQDGPGAPLPYLEGLGQGLPANGAVLGHDLMGLPDVIGAKLRRWASRKVGIEGHWHYRMDI